MQTVKKVLHPMIAFTQVNASQVMSIQPLLNDGITALKSLYREFMDSGNFLSPERPIRFSQLETSRHAASSPEKHGYGVPSINKLPLQRSAKRSSRI